MELFVQAIEKRGIQIEERDFILTGFLWSIRKKFSFHSLDIFKNETLAELKRVKYDDLKIWFAE